MSRRLLVTAAVVIAVATAGCAGLGGSLLGSERTETLTPVTVETPPSSPTSTPESLGTESVFDRERGRTDAILDPGGVIAAHERALRGQSFRLIVSQQVLVNGSVVRNSTYSRAVAADRVAYTARFDRTSGQFPIDTTIAEIDSYYDGSVLATRYRTAAGSEPRYTYSRNTTLRVDELAGQTQLGRVLGAFEGEFRGYASVPSSTVFGATRLSTPTVLPNPLGTSDPRNGEIVVEVFGDGYLRTTRVEYTVTVGTNRTGRVVRTIRIIDVGRTSVRTPDWLETAAATRDE